jgi:hypothetical protein
VRACQVIRNRPESLTTPIVLLPVPRHVPTGRVTVITSRGGADGG